MRLGITILCKKKVQRKSKVFYLTTDTYHATGRIDERVLPALCSAFSPVWTEVQGKTLADLFKGFESSTLYH